MADGGAEAEAKPANKLPVGEAVGDELKDDTPGISGEVMLVNTDSFEECNHDLDTQFSGGEDEEGGADGRVPAGFTSHRHSPLPRISASGCRSR